MLSSLILSHSLPTTSHLSHQPVVTNLEPKNSAYVLYISIGVEARMMEKRVDELSIKMSRWCFLQVLKNSMWVMIKQCEDFVEFSGSIRPPPKLRPKHLFTDFTWPS